MKRLFRQHFRSFLFMISIVGLVSVVGCKAVAQTPTTTPPTTTPPTPTPTPTTPPPSTTPAFGIQVTANPAIGNYDYLVDSRGMTLYWTSRDSAGKSNITGNTLANWPVFYIPSAIVAPPLKAADFSAITRGDGTMQNTFKGWPLYYFIKDKNPGDTLGQGVGGVWFVVDIDASGPSGNVTPTTTPVPQAPTVSITSPTSGASLPAGSIAVTAQVANFSVVDKQGQASVAGEGHLHFYLDVAPPTAPGQPAVPSSGVWAHVSGTTYTFANVTAGNHTIYVQLVNNDHTPVIPLVIAQVNITVTAAGGGGGGGGGGY